VIFVLKKLYDIEELKGAIPEELIAEGVTLTW